MDWGSYDSVLAASQLPGDGDEVRDTDYYLINMENYETFQGLYEYIMEWCEREGIVNVLFSIVVSTNFDYIHATLILRKLIYFMKKFQVFKSEYLN